jgi:predicted amidohydrolase YtcJ
VGLAADLVLIDGDVEATAPDALGKMAIALTICGGTQTHAAPAFA